ncbi:hypothetical protein K5F93_04435 [Pseudomonas protegens]|uniref:hypothetical protein n=1 Tax=Pseudomonas protegens TaxID=380021 RepID=UPI001C8ED21C|nr:hypothetical protein [Pseudomonas protegens]QZI71555.1 hypothetical protein K5F93_04435 [Pseudomonas protegens]
MGSLGKFIVVKGRFARDFINSTRTATAQNVADMNLNGALDINDDDFQGFCARIWWHKLLGPHVFGESQKTLRRSADAYHNGSIFVVAGLPANKKNGARSRLCENVASEGKTRQKQARKRSLGA